MQIGMQYGFYTLAAESGRRHFYRTRNEAARIQKRYMRLIATLYLAAFNAR